MSDCYKILNIPRDSDVKQIKRAYAALVKLHNPEDDPKGYQTIRKAYDEALKNLKELSKKTGTVNNYSNYEKSYNKSKDDSEIKDYNIEENSKEKFNSYEAYQKNNYRNINENDEQFEDSNKKIIEEFSNKLSDIYLDFNKRIDIDEWKKLFNDSKAAWNMELMKQIENVVFDFLSTHKLISYEVFELADKYFNWTDNKRELYDTYPEEYVKYVLYEINSSSKMSYKYLAHINKEKLKEYLILREKAYMYLKNNDIDDAYECIDDAYLIYQDDVELLILFGQYYSVSYDLFLAEKYLNKALKIDKNNKKAAVQLEEVHDIMSGKKEPLKIKKKSIERNSKQTKLVIRILICCAFLLGPFINGINNYYSDKSNNCSDSISQNYDTGSSDENEENSSENSANSSAKEINSSNEILSEPNNSFISINFDSIIPTDFYRLKCKDNKSKEIYILSKEEINKKNLWGNVAERVLIGKLDSTAVVFGSKDINNNSYNGYANNLVLGYVYTVDNSNYEECGLINKYLPNDKEKYLFFDYTFIDTDSNSDLK